MPTKGEYRGVAGNVERSLARLEKLVESAKSTLSHTRQSSLDCSPDCWTNPEDLLFEKRLKQVESNFKSDANKILLKMDKMMALNNVLFPRKGASEVRNKIKEINEKIESRTNVTGQSRRKLQSLINEKELKTRSSESGKQIKEKCLPVENIPEIPKSAGSPEKSKEDLKDKILQTKEIVDRGFQTARELAQKVESIAKTEKKVEEVPESEKTEVLVGKTSARENQKEPDGNLECPVEKVRKECKRKHKSDRRASRVSEGKNCSLVTIQEKESKKKNLDGPVLRFQQLPSLRIRGGLQIQKIHSLEILPEKEKSETKQTNTGVHIVSHEDIAEEKTKKLHESLLGKNGMDECLGSTTTCPNCGKVVMAPKTPVDPKVVDDVLAKCNFNVFDNRIEELAEKWSKGAVVLVEKNEHVESYKEGVKLVENYVEPDFVKKVEEKKIERAESRVKISELCSSLSKKYKEKAIGLRDDHDALKTLIRDLFERVDESRKFFGDLRHFSVLEASSKVKELKATKPVVVYLPGEPSSHRRRLQIRKEEEEKKEESSEEKEVKKKQLLERRRKVYKERRKHSVTGVSHPENGSDRIKKTVGNDVHLSSSSSSSSLLSVVLPGSPSKKNKNSKSDYESDFEGESNDIDKKSHSEGSKSVVRPKPEENYEKREREIVVHVEASFLNRHNSYLLDGTNPDATDASFKTDFEKDEKSPRSGTATPPPSLSKPLPFNTNDVSRSSKSSQNVAETQNAKVSQKTGATLKDVLSVLEDRIVRTRSLAEKLTEPVDESRVQNQQTDFRISPEHRTFEPECQERPKSRTEVSHTSSESLSKTGSGTPPIEEDLLEKGLPWMELSEGKSSSIGQVHREDVERTLGKHRSNRNSEKGSSRRNSGLYSPGQNSPLASNACDGSHSEGEILSCVQPDTECSSINSLGQVS